MTHTALTKKWFLDAQWSDDLPEEALENVAALWGYYELGNDRYILKSSIARLEEHDSDGFEAEIWVWPEDITVQPRGWVKKPMSLQPLIQYLKDMGVSPEEEVIIHWWW